MAPVLTIARDTFLRRVDEARSRKGWSDQRTCREAGIGQTWLKDYRRRSGEKRPGTPIITQLAAALEVPVSWLTEEHPEGMPMPAPLDERRLERARQIAKTTYDLCRENFSQHRIPEMAEDDFVAIVYDVLAESESRGLRTNDKQAAGLVALTIRRVMVAKALGLK